MLQEIKVVLSESGKTTETISTETSTVPADLVASLQELQGALNDMLTRIITSQGDSVEVPQSEDEDDESDGNTEDHTEASPKKRRT